MLLRNVSIRKQKVFREGKQQNIIRVVMYWGNRDRNNKFFDMQAPVDDKDKVRDLFLAVKSKGFNLPKLDDDDYWW